MAWRERKITLASLPSISILLSCACPANWSSGWVSSRMVALETWPRLGSPRMRLQVLSNCIQSPLASTSQNPTCVAAVVALMRAIACSARCWACTSAVTSQVAPDTRDTRPSAPKAVGFPVLLSHLGSPLAARRYCMRNSDRFLRLLIRHAVTSSRSSGWMMSSHFVTSPSKLSEGMR